MQGARLHLPEPSLPVCLTEKAPVGQEAVGVYAFAPLWLQRLGANLASDQKAASLQALECASDVGKSLREAIVIIRMNNKN